MQRPLGCRADGVWDVVLLLHRVYGPLPHLPRGHGVCLRPHHNVCTSGPWESPPAPSCGTGALQDGGKAVGTTHEGLCPMLYPIAYHQGGESLSATWTGITLYSCQPALWRGLGFFWVLPSLLVFACFAGCEEAMLSSRGSCGSLWGRGAGTGWWQGRGAVRGTL